MSKKSIAFVMVLGLALGAHAQVTKSPYLLFGCLDTNAGTFHFVTPDDNTFSDSANCSRRSEEQKAYIELVSHWKAFRGLFGGAVGGSNPGTAANALVQCSSIKNMAQGEDLYCLPEVDDVVVIGFFNGYKPQFSGTNLATHILAGLEDVSAEVAIIIMNNIEAFLDGGGNPVALIGLGSFTNSNVITKKAYDYEFRVNRNVARNYLKNGSLVTTGVGIPRKLLESIKTDFIFYGINSKLDPRTLVENALLGIIAVELDAGVVINTGPVYSYEQSRKAEDDPPSCWNSTNSAMHAKSYLKEVGEQPIWIVDGSSDSKIVSAFSVEIDGCGLILDHVGDVLE